MLHYKRKSLCLKRKTLLLEKIGKISYSFNGVSLTFALRMEQQCLAYADTLASLHPPALFTGFWVPPSDGKRERKSLAGSRAFAVTGLARLHVCVRDQFSKGRSPSCTCLPEQVSMNEEKDSLQGNLGGDCEQLEAEI